MSRPNRQLRFAIVAVSAVLTLAAFVAPLPAVASAPQARRIEISARQFAYEPATLNVQRGDTITVHLESLDAAHGLAVDGYAVNIQAEPGKSADVTFVADKEGKFKFRCSIACGTLHPFMIGELDVTPNYPFARAIIATLITAIGAVIYFWNRT
ncbi:MAG: cupredoxin domain-containing protein [Chloroflexi bacterium]|nr:cupredoxin domain-containing protein [Chloroflexota bacterium]